MLAGRNVIRRIFPVRDPSLVPPQGAWDGFRVRPAAVYVLSDNYVGYSEKPWLRLRRHQELRPGVMMVAVTWYDDIREALTEEWRIHKEYPYTNYHRGDTRC